MLLRLLLCLLLLPSLAHATTDWDEGFEYATNDLMDVVWSSSCPGNSGIIAPSTDRAHSGSRSLKLTYRGNEGVTPGFQSCYKDRDLTAATTGTLYTRFFIYIPSSFQPAQPTTKITLTPKYASDAYTTVWWAMIGGGAHFDATLQRTYNDPLTNDSAQNYSGGNIPRDQWVCLETQLTYGTPGQRNGIVRNWINDVQSMNITNALMDQVGQQSTMRGVRLYTQNGVGNIYYDDYAVSRDARIGCAGVAPPPPTDTTPPTTPTNVQASATIPLQNTVSWTASSDASSPITYTLLYCTPSPCTPALTVGATTSTGLAHTGVTGGTSYVYAVQARDPAGNTSSTSSTSTVTAIAAAGGGSSLVLNSSGVFVMNGTQTFLLGISYFDGQNYRTSDLDTLASRGFNTLRVFANWAPDLYAGARSVCDAAGALNATRRNQIQALIDYAKTKNQAVILVLLDANSDLLMPTQGNRTTCITNLVNYYAPTSAQANWNVMFDVVQEHSQVPWADTTAELKTYTDVARAACASCIIYASGDSATTVGLAPSDATVALDATMQAVIAAKVGTNAESLLAVHEFRSSNWYAVTGQRVAAYKAYLASIGKSSTPVIFDEPNRHGFTYSSSESQFDQAAADAKAAGAAMWVFHNGANFDMSTLSMFQQLDAVESAITVSMAAALTGGSSGVPVSLVTYDFAGTFANVFTGGYTGHETPNQTGGRLQALSTGNESLAKYTGAQASLTSLFTCTTANAGPPPSASWTTLSGNGFKVISNQCGTNNASGASDDQALWNTSYNADQTFQATLAAVPGTISNEKAFLTWRIQSAGAYDNFYQLDIKKTGASSWNTRLFKVVAGVYTQLGTTDTGTVANGDVYKVSAVGTTISAYRNGTLVVTATDSSISGAGYAALGSWYSAGGAGGTVRWTNFAGGNYSSSFSTPTNHGATVELTTLGAGSGIQNGIAVGLGDAPTYNGYACRWIGNPASSEIIRKDAGNRTTLTSRADITWSAGDIPGCFKNGNTIYMTKGSVTGSPILSVIDSTYATGGGVGLNLYNNGAAVGTNELDNLTIYQYGAPTPACTPTITAATVTASGATVTWPSSCVPSQIRVVWGDNGGTYSSASLEPITNFPGGVFAKTWDVRTQYACFYPVDAQGTVNTTDYTCGGVTIPVDTAEIVFGTAFPASTLPQGTTAATFGAPIDKVGTCLYAATDIAYSAMDAVNNVMNVAGLNASATISGLTDGSSTTRYIRCDFVDLLGTHHPNTTSKSVTIAVAAVTTDTTAPSTIAGVVAVALSESQVQVSWTAGTDNVLVSKYNVYGCSGAACSTYALMATVLSPVVTTIIPNLIPSLSYTFVVKAEDSSGNLSASNSNTATVSTPTPLDTTAPSDPVGLTVTGTYKNSATIAWTPGTDNKSAVSTHVEICSGSASCTAFSFVGVSDVTTYTIKNLTAITIYRVRIKHIDQAGNVSANYSERVTFTTASAGIILPRQPVSFSQPRLPRT